MSLFKTVTALAADMGRDSPLTIALVFARIASAGSTGLLQATVQRELNLAPAVLTKTVQVLSALNLIGRFIDIEDGRHRVLRLTEKGQTLAHHLDIVMVTLIRKEI